MTEELMGRKMIECSLNIRSKFIHEIFLKRKITSKKEKRVACSSDAIGKNSRNGKATATK